MIRAKRRPACALFALTALAGAAQLVLAQNPPTVTTVYALEPDEAILRSESTIGISAEAADVILVLARGGGQKPPYFVFRDGKKSGPYARLEEAMKAAYEGRGNTQGQRQECAAYDPGEPPDGARPVSDPAAGGQQVLRFKGKAFGPYMMLFMAKGTPDGAAAFYTAGDNDKAWFGCTDGRVVSFGGIPEDLKFSPDGKNAAVMVQGKLSLAEMSNLAKLPPEKLAATIEDQEKKYVYTIDGRGFGPFGSSFGSHSFWYPKSGNDLYYVVGDDVFRNGTLLFKSGSIDMCNFYPSPDGKTYALYTYESIVFSDGRTFPSPLDVAIQQRAGKAVFRWIALENEKRLVVYERAM